MGASIAITNKLRPAGQICRELPNQLIAAGAYRLIQLNHAGIGFTDGIEDIANYRLLPTRKGIYLITCSVTLLGLTTGEIVETVVQTATSTKLKIYTVIQALATDYVTVSKSVLCLYDPGNDQYLTLQVQHNGAGTVYAVGTNISENSQGITSLQAIRLRYSGYVPPA